MVERRKDKKGRVLKEGETQRKDGAFDERLLYVVDAALDEIGLTEDVR